MFYTLAKYVIYSTSHTYLLVKITKTLMIPRNPGKQHTFLKAELPHSVPASSVAMTSEVMIHSANIVNNKYSDGSGREGVAGLVVTFGEIPEYSR